MSAYSLRRRLLLWLFLATFAIGLLALADTWREAVRTAQGVSDRVLAGSALAIAERVSLDESGGLEVDIPYSSLEMLASTAQDQVFYRVDGPRGAFLTGYRDLAAVPVGADGIGYADGFYGDLRIRSTTLVRRISTGSESLPFTVTVAESTLARTELARQILLRSALRLLALILGVAAIVWLAVTLALRPLDRLGEAISQRSSDDLRPVRAHTPQEVELLVEAINSFMRRLETALEALRNFTGNASHQLRTPLSVVRTQLALVTRTTEPEQARLAADRADRALARAERVLAQLLVMARVNVAGGAQALLPTDIAAQARALTAELVPDALRCRIDLGYEGCDTAIVLAEPVLLAEILRNLIDNAIAYAGGGAVVTVRVRLDGRSVILEVEDNGPGIPADRLAGIVTQRRSIRAAAASGPAQDTGSGQPARSGSGTESGAGTGAGPATAAGYGLGFAIVSEIAHLFSAEFSLAAGLGGSGLVSGLRFGRRA